MSLKAWSKLASRNRKHNFSIIFSVVALAALVALVAVFVPLPGTQAAGAGVLSPWQTAPIRWNGVAPGGVALNDPLGLQSAEVMCQEGVNCDTFALNIAGTVSSWSGKVTRVR